MIQSIWDPTLNTVLEMKLSTHEPVGGSGEDIYLNQTVTKIYRTVIGAGIISFIYKVKEGLFKQAVFELAL